jgi:hypothetical protein
MGIDLKRVKRERLPQINYINVNAVNAGKSFSHTVSLSPKCGLILNKVNVNPNVN